MKTVELFEEDGEQILCLPEEHQFKSDYVQIRKVGDGLVLLPVEKSWKPLLDSLSLFSDDFMEDRAGYNTLAFVSVK